MSALISRNFIQTEPSNILRAENNIGSVGNANKISTYLISKEDERMYPNIYIHKGGFNWGDERTDVNGLVNDHTENEMIRRSQKGSPIDINPNGYNKVLNNITRLFEFQNLEDNWNMNGAKPFEFKHISTVGHIIFALKYQPDIFPTGRNSIQLEFEKQNGDYLEFEVYPDRIEYYLESGRNEEGSSISIDKIPEKVDLFYAA